MNENINKKDFVKIMDQMSRNDRLQVAHELCLASEPRLRSNLIPGAMLSEIAHVRTRVLVKRKASTWSLWKLWVFVMKPEGDLKNWRMTTTQCYRLNPKRAANNYYHQQYQRPRTEQTRTRRETIRDCNGDAVPRRWLDRFAPHIKTQADWDERSVYRNAKL